MTLAPPVQVFVLIGQAGSETGSFCRYDIPGSDDENELVKQVAGYAVGHRDALENAGYILAKEAVIERTAKDVWFHVVTIEAIHPSVAPPRPPAQLVVNIENIIPSDRTVTIQHDDQGRVSEAHIRTDT